MAKSKFTKKQKTDLEVFIPMAFKHKGIDFEDVHYEMAERRKKHHEKMVADGKIKNN